MSRPVDSTSRKHDQKEFRPATRILLSFHCVFDTPQASTFVCIYQILLKNPAIAVTDQAAEHFTVVHTCHDTNIASVLEDTTS